MVSGGGNDGNVGVGVEVVVGGGGGGLEITFNDYIMQAH